MTPTATGERDPLDRRTPTPATSRRGRRPAPSRVAVDAVHPLVDDGRLAAKASTIEPTAVVADVYADGHDRLAADATAVHRDTGEERSCPLEPIGNDRWSGHLTLDRVGLWDLSVRGWLDPWESWRRAFIARLGASYDVTVDLGDGAELLRAASVDLESGGEGAAGARDALLGALGDLDTDAAGVAHDPGIATVMRRWARELSGAAVSGPHPVEVGRPLAACSAWYELFPRSPVVAADDLPPAGPPRHATLRDAVERLDYVADLGFDVVYLPPIHPIGTTARKGPDNALVAGPDDPGSPWAIGGPAGGHTAIHPDLGTLDDFDALVAAARRRNLEIALDFAIQCSPEHPWVTEHPDWFVHRSDGSIRTAENPPKRYEDIYPIDFRCDDWEALWLALADVVRFWVDRGVRVFRVDNPHTKPFAFWQWLIAEVRRTHPDVVFLAEAFTRPRVLERLAKIGFDQSYGYFTWRRSAEELRSYFEDLSDVADFLRPNVWPNTPDILTDQLQHGGRPMHEARAVLAALLSANYGVYGPAFELMDSHPVRPGSEEYASSEKYQVRAWDLDRPDSLAPLLRRLNAIRSAHPALHSDRRRTFHHCDDPGLLCWSKRTADGGDTVLVVVNAEPDRPRHGLVRLDLAALGLPPGAEFEVRDLLGGDTYHWQGADNFVALDPNRQVAHAFEVLREAA